MAYDLHTLGGQALLYWLPITNFPFSMAVVAEHDSLATEGYPIGVGYNMGIGSNYHLGFRGDIAGDPVVMRRIPDGGGGGSNSPQSAAYSINTETRIAFVANAADDVALYVNGAKTTSTVSVGFPSAANYTSIGAFYGGGSISARCGGRVQQAAMCDLAALTDDEVNSFMVGFSPRRIRPQSLKLYAPCLRLAYSITSGTVISLSNVTQADQMRTYGM